MKNILLLLVLFAASSQLWSQQTQYIRDELYVPLRSGQSNQHRIVHKGLTSGTPLTVLDMSEDNLYTMVRTKSGIEGWIQTQYLSDQPAHKDLLIAARKTISKLEKQLSDNNQKLKTVLTDDKKNQQQLNALSKTNSSIAAELEKIKAVSADTIQLNLDNQRLLEENQALINQVEILSTDNKQLVDSQESDAFLNGAFAVLIGVMITLLVPRLWPKKSTEWV